LSKSHETISSKREEILKVVSPAKMREKRRREICNVLEFYEERMREREREREEHNTHSPTCNTESLNKEREREKVSLGKQQ